MKKRVLALFMTLAIAVCFVPTFSFANEAPATAEPAAQPAATEQPVAQQPVATEQPAAEPAEEDTVPTEEAAPAEEVNKTVEEPAPAENVATADIETQDKDLTGTWDKYTFKIKEGDSKDVRVVVIINDDNKYDIQKQGDDETANHYLEYIAGVVKKELSEAKIVLVDIYANFADTGFSSIDAAGDLLSNRALFTAIDTKVTVKDKAKKDVTFKYAIDSNLALRMEYDKVNDNVSVAIEKCNNNAEGGNATLLEDAVVLKKGSSEAIGQLVLRSELDYVEYADAKKEGTCGPIDAIIKEASNDGNYKTDGTLYGVHLCGAYEYLVNVFGADALKECKEYAIFKDSSAVDAFVTDVNSKLDAFCKGGFKAGAEYDALRSLILDTYNQPTMVFAHGKAKTKSNKDDAVGTGDSMNLALFGGMAVLALMGAAAVFATRREQ